jgi:hypothetical protein
MNAGELVGTVFLLLFFGSIALTIWALVREKRAARANNERSEALFRSMFPDLQPWFHPKNLMKFVRARRARPPSAASSRWSDPPGFEADAAEFRQVDGRERVRLLDAAGAVLAEFAFEPSQEGGVLRFGKGKFTVITEDASNPRVRYWHPDREFKWQREKWTFQSRVSDQGIESSDRGTSFSSDSPGSSFASGSGAGRAAAIAGAGGTFDGGGASAAWDAGQGQGTAGTAY